MRPSPCNTVMKTKRLTMKALIVGDWLDRDGECEKEVSGYFRTGKVKERGNSGGRNRLGGGRVPRPLRKKRTVGKIVGLSTFKQTTRNRNNKL